jgi:uncharacterized protein (TIGR02266 family)
MLRKKILLSDNPELLQALENSFLRRIGFSLEVADSGERAFEIIEEQDPLLAILSLEMPGWQGDAICRRVKRDAILRSTPIILVVPDGREGAVACCREAGCDDILSLPIDSQQLLATACRLLNIVERAAPRSESRFSVLCGNDPKKLRAARALNLNAGGLFIETDRLHPVNTPLTLEFTLPEQTAMIRAIGRVAWVNHPEWVKTSSLPSGLGIQFLELADADAAAVREYAAKVTLDSQ